MLEIAEEYMERHGNDPIAASLEFAMALRGGWQPSGAGQAGIVLPLYTLDNAIVAAATAFDLDMHQTIRLTAAALGQTWGEDNTRHSLRVVEIDHGPSQEEFEEAVRNHPFVDDLTETATEEES